MAPEFEHTQENAVTARSFFISIQGSRHENEDDYYVGKLPVFVITDGVTRTRLEDGSYPYPSGAALAAEIFAQEAGKFLEANYGKTLRNILRDAVKFGNSALAKLNESYQIPQKLDYLINDYFNTCAAMGVIIEGKLNYATIGDCQIAIFDNQDNLVMLTENTVSSLETYREGLEFTDDNQRQVFWREHLRNRPSAPYLTYGTLTGEPAALHYLKYGSTIVSKNDLIVFYTDGFANFVMLSKFRKILRSDLKDEYVEEFVEDAIKAQRVAQGADDDKTLIAVTVV